MDDRLTPSGIYEFIVGDAQKLPMGDNLFDIVLGEFIIGLVNDKEGAVSEYGRVAKPGGTIGLNEATWLKALPHQEIIGSFPRILYSLIRRPKFREFIKMSIAVPNNLLDYFGYGLYVGRAGKSNRPCATIDARSYS